MSILFPAQFADLEAIAGPWAIASANARYIKRLNSSMDEMQAFYDAVFPRASEILAYCNDFDINDPPEQMKALMNVLYSLIAVSFPVEVWKQPRVPDSGATSLEFFIEPAV
jgi:hypothetical protein